MHTGSKNGKIHGFVVTFQHPVIYFKFNPLVFGFAQVLRIGRKTGRRRQRYRSQQVLGIFHIIVKCHIQGIKQGQVYSEIIVPGLLPLQVRIGQAQQIRTDDIIIDLIVIFIGSHSLVGIEVLRAGISGGCPESQLIQSLQIF